MAQRKQIINSLWFIVPDFLWMMVALYLALIVKYGTSITQDLTTLHYRFFIPVYFIWLVIMFIHNLFDPKHLKRYTSVFFALTSAMFFNFIAAIVYFYYQPELMLTPRRQLIAVVIISGILILFWHLSMKMALKSRIREDYYLLSPAGELDDLHNEILTHSYLGFRIVGHINNPDEIDHLPQNGSGLIVPEKIINHSEYAKKIYSLRLKGINVHTQIEFAERLLRRVPTQQIDESWFLRNVGIKDNRLQSFSRRLIDLVVGLIFGLVFVVTFPVIALLIKFGSNGTLFFVQERVGLNGQIFRVYKYRTMSKDSTGKGWTKLNDPRITAVGKVLRKLHLDELPQFINLLKGNMSIVGPRPEQVEIVEHLRSVIPFYDERHLVKPGLTGWGQLNIYAGTLEESKLKLEYELYYLKHRNLFFDLEIILKTIYHIFVGR